MRTVFMGVGLLAIAGAAYVRLAPSDAARWHVPVADAPDPGAGGVKRLTDPYDGTQEDVLSRFATIAEEAGAVLLAGSPGENRVTYVARSRVFGFPDYITAQSIADGDKARLHVLSRLRFGHSDLGVNRHRLEEWLSRM